MLERLVQRCEFSDATVVTADVPNGVACTDLLDDPPTGWMALDSPEAVAAGAAWLSAGLTTELRMPPSIVPPEPNLAINPLHPDAARIVAGDPAILA